jgi:hypothetical protein
MSDNFEKFVKKNRDAFDTKTPSDKVWENLSGKLNVKPQPRPAGKLLLGTVAIATAMLITAFVFFGGERTNVSSEQVAQTQMVSLEGYNEFVHPPLKGVDIPYQSQNVDAKVGGKVELTSGTVISVPEDAFVNASGEPVKGEVVIKAREFHNTADLVASGIPMKFQDETGVYDFQTAGMIDIRGEVEGAPVFIAEAKKLEVKMASFAEEKDYNLYFLDPVSKKWQEIGQPQNAVNEEKQEAIAALPPTPDKPVAPQGVERVKPEKVSMKWSEGKIAIDSSSAKPLDEVKLDQRGFKNEFDFSVDYSQYPELKPFKSLKWKAVDEELIKKNRWVFTEGWNVVTLNPSNAENREYTLQLKNNKKTFSMVVTPLLDGKDFEKEYAKYQKSLKEFEVAIEKRKAEDARLNEQADLYRTFYASNFGVYNCDRYYRMGNQAVAIAATFEVGDEKLDANTYVFHCTGDSRALITLSALPGSNFTFDPREENCLLIVLPGNRLAVFSAADFKKLKVADVKAKGKQTFRFHVLDQVIKNAQDIEHAIHLGSARVENELPI